MLPWLIFLVHGLMLLGDQTGGAEGFGSLPPNAVLLIPGRFEEAQPFSEGVAAVKKDGKWLFIGLSGQPAFPGVFDYAGSFSEGYALVELGHKVGFIDHAGEYLVRPQFDDALSFQSGFAAVRVAEKWGYLSIAGTVKITPSFDEAGYFSEGLAPVKTGFMWGYIDGAERLALPPKFRQAWSFSCGLAAVEDAQTWMTGYINHDGKFEIRPAFRSGEPFTSDGIARVVLPNPRPAGTVGMTADAFWGYIDRHGKIVRSNQNSH